jgi:predicted secreted protein
MAFHLAVPFPSEAEALQKQAQAERHLTATQRLAAVADALAAVEALSRAGGLREAQLAYQQAQEDEWRRRMAEFIKKHVAS